MTNNFTNGRKRPTNFTNFMKSILSAARNRLRFLFEKFVTNSKSVRSPIREIREIRGRKKRKNNKLMKEEPFTIRAYGKSELAMKYFPDLTKESAMSKFRYWLRKNPRLKKYISRNFYSYTPKQVRKIIEEIGEPFDVE